MLLLKKVHGEETVFQGHLFNEKTSVCVVIKNASNPDDMEVKNKFYTIMIVVQKIIGLLIT